MTPENPPGAVLVANGPWTWNRALVAAAESAAALLAADGGANHLARIGLKPHHVIGDLDSIDAATRTWVGEERLLHRPEQDHTDLEKAVAFALDELRLDSLQVFAALGGRLDHVLANLGLLARRALGPRLLMVGAEHQVLAATGRLELAAVPGETWSFCSFDPAVRVSLDGVQWPVTNAPLDPVGGGSISNRATAQRVVVDARGGAVLVLRHHLGA